MALAFNLWVTKGDWQRLSRGLAEATGTSPGWGVCSLEPASPLARC